MKIALLLLAGLFTSPFVHGGEPQTWHEKWYSSSHYAGYTFIYCPVKTETTISCGFVYEDGTITNIYGGYMPENCVALGSYGKYEARTYSILCDKESLTEDMRLHPKLFWKN